MEQSSQVAQRTAHRQNPESSFTRFQIAHRIPTRILMTTDCVGGVWNYSLDLADGLAPYGVQIGLATMGPPPSQSQRGEAARIANLEIFEGNYKLEWMDS